MTTPLARAKLCLALTSVCAPAHHARAAAAGAAPPAPPDATIVLSVFEVTSARDAGYRVENAVATTGIAASIAKTPLPIVAVSAEFLRDAGLVDFRDALRYVSSASLDPNTLNGNYGIGANLGVGNGEAFLSRFRGHPLSAVLRDGLGDQFGNSLDSVDRIEVAKGPMAVFVGGGNAGGLINFVTKRPQFSFRGEASARIDEEGRARAALDVTGPLLPQRLAYRVIASHEDGRTWRDFSNSRTSFLNPQLLWRPWRKLQVRATYQTRHAEGNLVSAAMPATNNYQRDFDAPGQTLLDLGRLRASGQPFSVTEYRNRIGRNFTQWRQDVFDTTGRWTTLGDGEWLGEGVFPTGRRANALGPWAPFQEEAFSVEGEISLAATEWLSVRAQYRRVENDVRQDYYSFVPRIFPVGGYSLTANTSVHSWARSWNGRLESVVNPKFDFVKPTVLLGYSTGLGRTWRTEGAWDLTRIAPQPGSPNVFGTPAQLTGNNVFAYFDPRVHPFPNVKDAQAYQNDVRPAGQPSIAASRGNGDSYNAYTAASLAFFDDRLILTGGYRRVRAAGDLSAQLDRDYTVLSRSRGEGVATSNQTFGLVVEPIKGLNVYASLSDGISPGGGSRIVQATGVGTVPTDRVVTPAERNLPQNRAPDPGGKGREAGVKFDLVKTKLSGSVGYFRIERSNIPFVSTELSSRDPRNVGTDIDPNPATRNSLQRQWVNVLDYADGNTAEGFEADLVWTPLRGYSAVLGATHLITNRLTVKSNGLSADKNRDFLILNGRPLTNTPDTMFRLFQRYEFGAGVLQGGTVALGTRYQSSLMPTADDANWGTVNPSYWVFDLVLGYRHRLFGTRTQLQLGINNLGNTSYSDSGRSFAPPRQFWTSVTVQF